MREKGNTDVVMTISNYKTNEGYICEEDGYVYFSVDNGLYKEVIDGDGAGKQLLVEENCREICVVEEYVYYISDLRIKRVNKNGGEAVVLTEETAVYMQVAGDRIYFTGYGVYSMGVDGSDLRLLTKNGIVDDENPNLCWVNVYGDFVLYVSLNEHESLYAVKKDGKKAYKLAEHVRYPVVYGDCVYYQWKEYGICELDLLSGEQRDITGDYRARQVFLDEYMFCTDFRGIYCVRGKETEELVYPMGIAESESMENDYFVELFWITSNRIYFVGSIPESKDKNVLKYIDRLTGAVGVMK